MWRAGGTSVDAPSADDASFPRPSAAAAQSSTAKPAPWARPTAATSNFAIRSQSPPAADAGADSVERRERSGSNLSASAGAAFAASLTSAGTVRPALPSARPNVKKWAEMDSDEENDGAEAPKPADEPVVEVTDDMRFTTSNSVGGLRDDAGGSGANYRMGNGYNDFGPRDRHNMHNQRYGGSSAGGGGGRFDDNGPRHYRREGYDDRDRSSGAYGAPYSGHHHSRMHSRHDEGFHGGMHGGEYQRNRVSSDDLVATVKLTR